MKFLLLLPALMFGLSFACDQPHEEIEGIKMGCPYTGDLSLGTPKNKDNNRDDAKTMIYEQRLENSLFDSAEIEVIDGKIESIVLSKIFYDLATLKRSGRSYLSHLMINGENRSSWEIMKRSLYT